VIQPTKQTV